jgi:hypothetical protein
MATNQIKLEITVDEKGAVTSLNTFGDTAKKVGKDSESAFSNAAAKIKENWLGMAAAATAAFVAIEQVVAKPIAAYMESETALMKLGVAMKNQGIYTASTMEDLVAFSETMQKTTSLEDDLAKSIMGTLVSFGMTTEEVKISTQAAADMATFTGKSIETVAEMLGKAYAGNTASLSKYGIVIDESIPKSEKFSAVLSQLEQRFGGSAQAELLTYSGQWKQLQNIWGDVQEFLGHVFLKTIHAIGFAFNGLSLTVNGVIAGILQGLTWVSDSLGKFASAVGMGEMAASIGSVTASLKGMADHSIAATMTAQKFAEANWKAMTATDSVSAAIDKMGVSGKRTQPVIEGLGKAGVKAAKDQEEALEELGDFSLQLQEAITDWDKKQLDKRLKEFYGYLADIKRQQKAYQSDWEDINDEMAQADGRYLATSVKDTKAALNDKEIAFKTFADGVKKGYDDMLVYETTWAHLGLAAFEGFTTGASTVFSSLFRDVMKGDLDSFSVYWEEFTDTLYDTFADTLAKMLTEWVTKKVTEFAIDIAGDLLVNIGSDLLIAHGGAYSVGHGDAWRRGLGYNEVPAILEVGEMVIPKDDADLIRSIVEGGPGPSVSEASYSGGSFSFSDISGKSVAEAVIGAAASMAMGTNPAVAIGQKGMGMTQRGAINDLAQTIGEDMGIGMSGKAVAAGIAMGTVAAALAGLGPVGAIGVGAMAAVATQGLLGALESMIGADVVGDLDSHMSAGIADAIGAVESGFDAQGMADAQANSEAGSIGGGFGADGPGTGGPGDSSPGFSYGGLSTGPESGYYARLHGTEMVVSQKGDVPVVLEGGAGGDLVSELRQIRTEIKTYGYALAKSAALITRILERWDGDGIPAERVI